VWYKPTGWRPADVEAKYPIHKIENVYAFEKYDTPFSKLLLAWTWVQLIMLLLFVSYLFGNIAMIGKPGIFVYGGFIFLFVYALSELMDNNKFALGWEFLKCTVAFVIISYSGDWFGVSIYSLYINYFLLAYFILSLLVTSWFSFNKKS
jgi:hypothetical protein